MTAISTAVGTERLSRVSGYRIRKGYFSDETPNLPQVIGIFGEANTANQASIDFTKREIISADEAGRIYGYGSPIHQQMRILRPVNSDGVGGIPTIVFPQKSAVTATAFSQVWEVTGTANKNFTHSVIIAGRNGVDFQNYSFNVAQGDTGAIIALKIVDAVNSVLSSPVSAEIDSEDANKVIFTTKWKGVTASETKIGFDTNNDLGGLMYAITETTQGSGVVDLADSFEDMADLWVTGIVNPYTSATYLAMFENFNGVPYVDSPTGRYTPTVFKPFMSFFGFTGKDREDFENITNNASRVEQVTNVLCPAPGSEGYSWEAAANVVRLFARTMQDNPEKDVNGQNYPDMPIPIDGRIGDISNYNVRDLLVKKGCSTVTLEKNQYKVQDLVTTYHPEGETPLQFSYCRNLNLDWNIFDGYRILEERKVKDKVIIRDDQFTDSRNAIKPKEWKAVLYDYFDSLAVSALINEPDFSKSSLKVQISATNPNRIETFFRYKRTGIARIESTDVEAGF